MAKNTDLTSLDINQAGKRIIEESNDAIRTTLVGGSLELGVEIDAADGDSIQSLAGSANSDETIDGATSGEVVAAQDCQRLRQAKLYVETTSAVTTPQDLDIQVSPVDSGDVWHTLESVTPSSSAGIVVSTDISLVARRIRVNADAVQGDGELRLMLVLRS
jgi:hypothetical protein